MLCLIFFGIIIFVFSNKFECPVKKYIGIPCPSCGLTRAFILLLQMKFKESFKMHPMLIFILPAIFLAFIQDNFYTHKNKFVNAYIYISSVSFFIVYIIRLATNSIP